MRDSSIDFNASESKTMEQGLNMVDTILGKHGLQRTGWELCRSLSPWKYTTVTIDGSEPLRIGVSAGGVVSVNGDPFTPHARDMNVTLDAIEQSIISKLSHEDIRDARDQPHQAQYVVKDECTLGYLVNRVPDTMAVLASTSHGHSWRNGPVSTIGSVIRPAKADDFDRFRIELPGDFAASTDAKDGEDSERLRGSRQRG